MVTKWLISEMIFLLLSLKIQRLFVSVIEFFTMRISVRLSDRSTQHKINFVKNCPQWGLNSQPPDLQSHALPTMLSHYLVVGVNH